MNADLASFAADSSWTNRLKRLAAMEPDLDISSMRLLVRVREPLHLTDYTYRIRGGKLWQFVPVLFRQMELDSAVRVVQ